MARTSLDFNTKFETVFQNNQNASASGSKSILGDFYAAFEQLHNQMVAGLEAPQTQFTHTKNCRSGHEAHVSDLEDSHNEKRKLAHLLHSDLISETYLALQQFEQTRKALINAKRIRNTMINRLRQQLRHLRILSTIPDELKNTCGEGEAVYAGQSSLMTLAKSSIKDMIKQLKENYTHSARHLTAQQKWNCAVIQYLLTQLQDNIDTQLTTLTQNAATCKQDDAEALEMALYEFSVEFISESHGQPGSVHVEKHPNGYLLTRCSIYGSIQDQRVIKHFAVNSHTTEETRAEFAIAQEMARHGMVYRHGGLNHDNDDESHDNTWLLESAASGEYEDDSWIQNLPAREDDELVIDQQQHDDDGAEINRDEFALGDETPKASHKTSSGSGQTRDKHVHFSSKKKSKAKKQPFKPFQLCENTNHTTGSLDPEECVSRRTHDAFKQHVSKQITKEVSNRARSGIKRSGSCDKNVCQRWNKTHAAKKTMLQAAISLGYE
jgi:hypothetical protein